MEYDFGGWATRNNVRCSDGRIIGKDAFKHQDGTTVPLVYNHDINSIYNVLGHVTLENRSEGVYAYGKFNESPEAQRAKMALTHGDLDSLSIRAGRLRQSGDTVIHGNIAEVSLVLAGANSGAKIDNIIVHGAYGDYENEEEAIIACNEIVELKHSDIRAEQTTSEVVHADSSDDKTVADVFNGMTEDQKKVVYFIASEIAKQSEDDVKHSDETEIIEGGQNMKSNPFENGSAQTNELIHAEDLRKIIERAKTPSVGSLQAAVKEYMSETGVSKDELTHGITNLEVLYPDAQLIRKTPDIIGYEDGWVNDVMSGTNKTPFSNVRTVWADITADEARARGYIKGKQKEEEFFSLMKRVTMPTTVYKLQKLDRDDVIDITDIDIVAFMKTEMRFKLMEELARAILIGDGRSKSADNKINEQCIRPIWTDEDVFTIKAKVDAVITDDADTKAKKFIKTVIKSRKQYKGSGSPVLYTTEDVITDCLLLEDTTGRTIYDSVDKLATKLRVSKIVTVPVMENARRTDSTDRKDYGLLGIIVNLKDYNVGANKGGAVTMFDDFDINFNKLEYLIETRQSGALTRPYSAIAVEIPYTAEPSVGG